MKNLVLLALLGYFATSEISVNAIVIREDPKEAEAEVGLLGFISFLLQIFQRISLTVLIQLVTSSVQTSHPLRSVRLLSLLSVLFFFVFLKQTATIGSK